MEHRRCVGRRVAQPREHRGQVEAAVEPVAELGQVARQMLRAELVTGPVRAALDVAEVRVERAEVLQFDAGGTAAGDHRLVLDAGGGAAEAAQTVADDDAVGVDELLGPRGQFVLAEALDNAQAQGHGVTVVGLGQRRDDRGLVGRAAPGRLPVALPASVDVVDLDDAGEPAVGIAFEHDLQELVLEAPGGGAHGFGVDGTTGESRGGRWCRTR